LGFSSHYFIKTKSSRIPEQGDKNNLYTNRERLTIRLLF
jgi:hypothetical protein